MNNLAITNNDIAEALQRSASALAAGNNTLDQNIALITAANEIVQDPAKVGGCVPTYQHLFVGKQKDSYIG